MATWLTCSITAASGATARHEKGGIVSGGGGSYTRTDDQCTGFPLLFIVGDYLSRERRHTSRLSGNDLSGRIGQNVERFFLQWDSEFWTIAYARIFQVFDTNLLTYWTFIGHFAERTLGAHSRSFLQNVKATKDHNLSRGKFQAKVSGHPGKALFVSLLLVMSNTITVFRNAKSDAHAHISQQHFFDTF